MKKLLLFASAIVCASIGNAQVFQMDGEAFGLSNEYANVEAGLIWGEAGSATIFNPFTDELRLYDCKCNNYNQVVFDGSDVIMTNKGVQGGMNPKDINYGNPGISLEPPAYGSVVAVKASAEGYLYIVAKLSSNKNYYVFEDGIPIGFTFAMQANSEAFPDGRIKYSAVGEGAHNVITDAKWTNWPEKVILGTDAADVRVNGLGVIGFPVHPGCDYLIGAGASKIPWCGVYFTYYPCDVVLRGTDVENPVEDFVLIEGNQDLQARCNVITYTTSDEQVIWPDRSANFGGPSIISNVYQDGEGTITFDGNITAIGSEAFASVSKLTSIEIPSSVTSIGSYAFFNCSSLKSTVLSSGINSIESCAFAFCSSLNSITIPSSVNTIGGSAFLGCDNLKRIVVSENVAECRNNDSYGMFEGISNTCTLYVPKGYKTAYQNAPGWKEFQNIVELGNTITYTSSDGQVINPNNVNAFGANIVSNEYSNGKGLITFDGNVTYIGNNAFSNCSSLTSIDIPSTVQTIHTDAFAGCSSLSSIVIPSSVNLIYYDAFRDCCSLTSMFVSENIPIADPDGQKKVFIDIAETCTLYVPLGYKQAYQSAYEWRDFANIVEGTFNVIYYTTSDGQIANPWRQSIDANIVSNVYENGFGILTFDRPIIDLGDNTFQARNLTAIIIPSCVERIGRQAFDRCSSLTSITIPESVRRIDAFAFDGCHSLTSINIPSKVASIDSDVFAHCTSLNSITVESGNTTYDSRNNCNAIIETASNTLIAGCNNTVIPESVTSIGRGAFKGSSLESLKIPTSVTSIGGFAFDGCLELKTITIPSSVTKIGGVVFQSCSHLQTIYVSKNVADVGGFAFNGITTTCTLMVPKGYKSIYRNADEWGEIQNIQEYGDIAIVGCNDLLPSELRLDWGTRHQPGRWAEAIDASTGEVLEDVVWSSNRYVYLSTDSYYGWQNLNNPQQFIEAQYPGLATINVHTTDGLDRTASVNIRILADFDASGWIGNNLFYERKYIEDPFNSYQLAGPYSLTITGSGDMYTSNDNPYDYQPQYWYDENAISLPEGLTSISSVFFMLQPRITTIELPSTLERIDQFAFYGSGLKSITLPASMKQIGDEAFGSTSLQTVICEALTPPSISQYTFYDVSSCTLKVPYASLNAYYNDPYWGRFGEITSIEGYARVCYFPAGYPSCMVTGEVQSGLYAATENGTSVTLWSSNPEVVTINNGVLTGIAPGTATIYAMANDPGQASNSFTLVVYLDGDANGNGKVTIADATTTVSHILDGSNTPASFVRHAANVNRSDYDINVADVSGIVDIAMNNMEYNAPQRAKRLGESDETVNFRVMPFSIEQGKTTTVPIIVENPTTSFSAFEFTMHLPSGIRVKLDEDGNAMASLSTDRIIDGDQYSFSSRYSEDDNALHVICFSSGNVPFEGHDGIVANVTFEADNLMTTGDYVLTVGETILSDHGEIIRAADESVTFSVGNGQVGISTIGDDTTHTLMIYDLEGRLIKIGGTIDELPAGCYIVNGEKVIK